MAALPHAELEALSPAERQAREAAWAGEIDRLSRLTFDREAQWEAAFSDAETWASTFLRLAADTNRCAQTARAARE